MTYLDAFWSLLNPLTMGLLGLCIGSFLNVVIHRMPLMLERQWLTDSADMLTDSSALVRASSVETENAEKLAALAANAAESLLSQPPLNLATPGSRCPECGRALKWHENLPLLGWLMSRGRCSGCKATISVRYPVVEAITGLLFATLTWRLGATPSTLAWCGLVAALIALAAIDWDTTLLPDGLTLPLMWAGLLLAALGVTIPINSALWGAIAGYLSLWGLYWAFKLVTGKEGMGYGDFKLLAALGAWLGAPMLIPVILISSVTGALWGLWLKYSGGLRESRQFAFGPFLVAGAIVCILLPRSAIMRTMGWA